MRVFRAICAVAWLLLCLASGTEAHAQPSTELGEARSAFRAGHYDEARALLTGLLYPTSRLSDPRELAEAHLLLGITHLETGNPSQAEREIEQALFIDQSLSLDPLLFSSRAVKFFKEKKDDIEEQARADEERVRLARERDQLQRILKNLVVLEQRSYWVNFVPFGAGQFQNGHTKKGIMFLASEMALGGISLSLFSFQVAKYGFSGKVPPDEADRVNRIRVAQLVSGGLFFGVVAWGLADSLIHYEHVVSRAPDPALLKDLEQLDIKTNKNTPPPKPPQSSFRLFPTAGPNSIGLGFGMEF